MATASLAVIIGRFQPVHRAHLINLIIPATSESDHVLIVLGSSNRAPSPKNPFSPEQREEMIRLTLRDEGIRDDNVHFVDVDDSVYTEGRWVEQVQKKVEESRRALEFVFGTRCQVVLYGAEKDKSSYYIHSFPQWELRLRDCTHYPIGSTNIRASLFEGGTEWEKHVTPSVKSYLDEWYETEGEWFTKEHLFYLKYRIPYEEFEDCTGHGYIALTVDAFVLHKGRILLIKRGHHPGKGLWALPGGYLEKTEAAFDAAIRECKEETRLRLRKEWLVTERLYDDPDRSQRGRVITMGFVFRIPENLEMDDIMNIQSVQGGSDASGAFWVPISSLSTDEFRRGMFEDHLDICRDALSKVG